MTIGWEQELILVFSFKIGKINMKKKILNISIFLFLIYGCGEDSPDSDLIKPYLFGSNKLDPSQSSLTYPSDITASSMVITWSINEDPNFVAYKLYCDTISTVSENSTLATTITDINTTSYKITGLGADKTYYFRLYVLNSNNNTIGSNIIYGKTSSIKGVWTLVTQIPNVTFQSVYFISDTNGYIAGFSNDGYDEGEGIIYHWNGSELIQEILPDCYGLSDIKFIDANSGYAVGKCGTFLSFYDGNWTKFSSPVESVLFNTITTVSPLSNDNIWCAESNDLYYWDGSEWSEYQLNVDEIEDIYFIDSSNGWLVDEDGKLYHYNGIGWSLYVDLSVTWESDDQNWGYGILSFFNNSSGGWFFYQADNFSIWDIFHFDGNTWNEYSEEPFKSDNRYIYDISGISESNVWAVGLWGCIYNYNGSKWKSVTSPVTSHLYGIYMLSMSDGWAV